MKTRIIYLIGLLSFFFAMRVSAQLTIAVQMYQNPSPYISDWKSKPNTLQFFITNPTGSNVEVRFDGYIKGDKRGKVAETKLDAAIPPVVIPPGSITLNAVDAHLLEENAVKYVGSSKAETEKSGRLPEDNFQICVRLVTYIAPHAALTPEMCANFKIVYIQPPTLINPQNLSNITVPPTFQWSVATLNPNLFMNYELTLIELDPGQTNPGVAMSTNIPLIQRQTNIPTYVLLPSDPPLIKNHHYAWRVRAYDANPFTKYMFANNGYSEIWTFIYDPVLPPLVISTTISKDEKSSKDLKQNVDIKIGNVSGSDFPFQDYSQSFVLNNSTIKGKIYYTFYPDQLFVEEKLGESQGPDSPDHSDLKRLPNVTLRLIRHYKVVPYMPFKSKSVFDNNSGKSYDISHNGEIVGVTTSDANGEFSFSFIEGEPTVLAANTHLTSGSGEFSGNVMHGTLYKYYTIEVLNPYYCSSQREIPVEPGKTISTVLSSLVRTYNLEVTIKDAIQDVELGGRVTVYIARLAKNWVPNFVPENEGELLPPEYIIQKGELMEANTKFISDKLGYVIDLKGTEEYPKGKVLFTRLVRSTGGIDGYMISARTHEKKPDGNVNALFYEDADFALWEQRSANTIAQQGQFGQSTYCLNFCEPVVYNSNFKIPTFTAKLDLYPKPPRLFGTIKRSDSQKNLVDAVVFLEPVPAPGYSLPKPLGDLICADVTDMNGYFDIMNITPTENFTYTIKYLRVGFNSKIEPDQAFAMGRQRDGSRNLTPRLIVTRTVVDEEAQPLPGVRCILGYGKEEITNDKGTFASQAIPGNQLFHLEKKPDYAVKDTFVVIQDNPLGEFLGMALKDKIVMFKAMRRLEVKVVDQTNQPIEGAVVTLKDIYYPPQQGSKKKSAQQYIQSQSQTPKPMEETTDANGIAQFAYASNESHVVISVRVPNSDFIPRPSINISSIKEDGTWRKAKIQLKIGGRITGVVYVGEKKPQRTQGKGNYKQIVLPPDKNVHAKGARVFIEYHNELTTLTNDKGEYELRGVPLGMQTIKAAKSSKSVQEQTIGDEAALNIASGGEETVDLYLTKYNDMDITKLLGFPLEIDALTELAGGKIKIDGAFVDLPKNAIFKTEELNSRYPFKNITLIPLAGSGTPPKARPVDNSIKLDDPSIGLFAYDTYRVDLELSDPSGIIVSPVGSDYLKGQFKGMCKIVSSSLPINSNILKLEDEQNNSQTLYLGVKQAAQSKSVQKFGSGSGSTQFGIHTNIGAITSEGIFDLQSDSLHIVDKNGADTKFKLYDYNSTAGTAKSHLIQNGLHFYTTAHATIPATMVNGQMFGTLNVELVVGDVHINTNGVQQLNTSTIPSQTIKLQMWDVLAETFGFESGYFNFNGKIKAPLVPNIINDNTTVLIPFTKLELHPATLAGGIFNFTELDLLGIAKMKMTNPIMLAADQKSWFISTNNPEIPVSQGGGKSLEGLDPSEKFLFDNFRLRSDATKDIIPKTNKSFVVYDVGDVTISSFQFGYLSYPYIEMQCNLKLINIDDLAAQYTRITYRPGGLFGMDGVFIPNTPGGQPYNAGGVKLTIANGLLGPDGFTAEGDWGQFKNRIILDNKFSFNVSFRHQKIGSGYSTIAEIINSTHTPSQQQSLFSNTSGPDVKNVYGRTQMETDKSWSTHFVGSYKTNELAGKDSMYFIVQGSGGNGTVALASATLKMKGTSGGLGSKYISQPDKYPKGPSPQPEPLADSPFTDMSLTPDFTKMALIAAYHIEKEISPGNSFKGDSNTVISFGPSKFWYFFYAGQGQITNPPCSGLAVFAAGLNYTLTGDQIKLFQDYSLSGIPLPDEFKTLTGFYTQVAATLPAPLPPSFSIDIAVAHITFTTTLGGETRLGLNFANATTFYIGIYSEAKMKFDASAGIKIGGVGLSLSNKALLKAWASGFFTYNSDAGAFFDMSGGIKGELVFTGSAPMIGDVELTLFEVGGEINARLGNGSYYKVNPTFSFLGF